MRYRITFSSTEFGPVEVEASSISYQGDRTVILYSNRLGRDGRNDAFGNPQLGRLNVMIGIFSGIHSVVEIPEENPFVGTRADFVIMDDGVQWPDVD